MVAPWAHQESCGRVRCAGDTTSQVSGDAFSRKNPLHGARVTLPPRGGRDAASKSNGAFAADDWILTNLDRRREYSQQGWDAGTVPDS